MPILLLSASLLAYEAWHLGVTVDEPSHVLSAKLYWEGRDRLQPQDMPPVIKIVGGWVPHLLGIPLTPDHQIWKTGHEWPISTAMMEAFRPSEIRRFFFLSRLPFLLFPLALAFLLWWWARQILGAAAALGVAVLFVLEPTALGHGALIKNDLAATLGYLAFWYAVWNFWRAPDWPRVLGLSLVLLFAAMTKLSMFILIPIALAVVILRGVVTPRIPLPGVLSRLVCLLAVLYVGVATLYRWDLRTLHPAEVGQLQRIGAALPIRAVAPIFQRVPLPGNLWEGIRSLAAANSAQAPVYFMGQTRPAGHPLYFVAALALKIPITLQLLLLAGLAAGLARRATRSTVWFLALPPAIYVTAASLSTLQLGVRLVLPALPFGLLIAGFAVRWLLESRRPVLMGVVAAAVALESLPAYPSGIGFVNRWAGTPHQAVRYIGDSNLDWGQGLPELSEFVRRRRIRPVRLAYFGMDQPNRYFGPGEYEFLVPPWGPEWAKAPRLTPQPGAYYAISATLLTGSLFAPEYRDYYDAFRSLQPVATPGGSIYVYRIGGH